MDKIAFITASRCARKAMVTACSERIDFIAPVKNGDLVEVVGRISRRGNTSLTVAVELFSEDLLTGNRKLCAEGNFVFVAINEDNKPVQVNPTPTIAR
jgi:acyl-CoA hydrolase